MSSSVCAGESWKEVWKARWPHPCGSHCRIPGSSGSEYQFFVCIGKQHGTFKRIMKCEPSMNYAKWNYRAQVWHKSWLNLNNWGRNRGLLISKQKILKRRRVSLWEMSFCAIFTSSHFHEHDCFTSFRKQWSCLACWVSELYPDGKWKCKHTQFTFKTYLSDSMKHFSHIIQV